MVRLATSEQLASIAALIELLHVPKEDQDKWLDKAGASAFAELDEVKAVKILSFLSAKLPK